MQTTQKQKSAVASQLKKRKNLLLFSVPSLKQLPTRFRTVGSCKTLVSEHII